MIQRDHSKILDSWIARQHHDNIAAKCNMQKILKQIVLKIKMEEVIPGPSRKSTFRVSIARRKSTFRIQQYKR